MQPRGTPPASEMQEPAAPRMCSNGRYYRRRGTLLSLFSLFTLRTGSMSDPGVEQFGHDKLTSGTSIFFYHRRGPRQGQAEMNISGVEESDMSGGPLHSVRVVASVAACRPPRIWKWSPRDKGLAKVPMCPVSQGEVNGEEVSVPVATQDNSGPLFMASSS
jgi:hypothetical protein